MAYSYQLIASGQQASSDLIHMALSGDLAKADNVIAEDGKAVCCFSTIPSAVSGAAMATARGILSVQNATLWGNGVSYANGKLTIQFVKKQLPAAAIIAIALALVIVAIGFVLAWELYKAVESTGGAARNLTLIAVFAIGAFVIVGAIGAIVGGKRGAKKPGLLGGWQASRHEAKADEYARKYQEEKTRAKEASGQKTDFSMGDFEQFFKGQEMDERMETNPRRLKCQRM